VTRNESPGGEWLVVIDVQRVFRDDGSPWCTAGFAEMVANIRRLVPLFDGRVVFTRFVPPETPDGSWLEYYRRWSFAQTSEAEGLWELVEPWQAEASIDCPTFSKWGAALKAATGGSRHVVLCGASTDCCVLATAFAAMDDGAEVRVVSDACTSDHALHEQALSVLARRAPQLVLSSTEEEIRRANGPGPVKSTKDDRGG
jgi:nicotinamidase-related amidase